MAGENYEENKNKIVFNMPSSTKLSSSNDSPRDVELKDKLMKLIIDTHDEAIELKVNGEHYRRVGIHDEWRQVDFDNKKATYFSYQEKAVKDFIYRFNKCGILSDQVGMGKTIEAGMIVTELAYRKELGSLLILVPNENMAEKWEVELARKFGFRNYYKDLEVIEGKEETVIKYEDLPKVKSIKSKDDIYSILFTAHDYIHSAKGKRLDDKIRASADRVYEEVVTEDRIKSIRKIVLSLIDKNPLISSKDFKMMVLKEIYVPLISDLVKAISIDMDCLKQFEESGYFVDLNGIYYHIIDMNLDTPINTSIVANGIMERLIDKELICNSIVNEFDYLRAPKGKNLIDNINTQSKNATTDEQRLKYVKEFKDIAAKIKQLYAILIVSKIVLDKNKQINLLDFCLNKDFESEATRHCSVQSVAEKGYFLIDLLIDMSYKTLIVDEAHDFIKVSHRQSMTSAVTKITNYEERQREGIEFSDVDMSKCDEKDGYYVFPLYNDYYFVKKDCLYLKVKALAERSYRKIFMTATPIKSDMIDFYLLYLLADNSDVNTFNRIRKILDENNENISTISGLLMGEMSNSQKNAMNYLTREDLVIKYIYKYYISNQEKLKGTFDKKIINIINKIVTERTINKEVLKSICVNEVRKQFQDTFTIRNEETGKDEEITSISDLVSKPDGIEHWQNMYSQIGIRSTRHQTFKLDEEHLSLINEVQKDKYRNLPTWSRRNGTILYINKRDNYFDLIVKEKLEAKKFQRSKVIDNEKDVLKYQILDFPMYTDMKKCQTEYEEKIAKINSESNSDVIKDANIQKETMLYNQKINNIETKYKPKKTALSIYNYINEQLTGTLNESYYDSKAVDYDEFKLHMVASLMTDGVLVEGKQYRKKISGKVLLFADEKTQKKVLDWLINESKDQTMKKADLDAYIAKFKHEPIWYYNKTHTNPEEKWIITTDIKSLKEKKGNYLIVVEPNKYEEGVDLQSSNTLINFDIKFCPLKMEQRIGRIDRVKLSDDQPQLDIISFTPLNDMSGFMVDFLANELQMFNCWRGDTTGIVSMPLGDKPNSATFEDAILQINEAYKYLYAYDGPNFLASLKKVKSLINNFKDERFDEFNNFITEENTILEDLDFLKGCSKYINSIVYNTAASSNDDTNDKDVSFGMLKIISEKRAVDSGEIDRDSMSNHTNDINQLREGIDGYYRYNIKKVNDQIYVIKQTSENDLMDKEGGIDPTRFNPEIRLVECERKLKRLNENYDYFKQSKLYKMGNNATIKQKELDIILNPIVGLFKGKVCLYLDELLKLFDYFCENVKDKSEKMTRFISYLTIEEFKVMAGNYE